MDLEGIYKKKFFSDTDLLILNVGQLILKNPQENYAVFICCGLIPWTFFSSAITRSAFTMVENGNIVKKDKYGNTLGTYKKDYNGNLVFYPNN